MLITAIAFFMLAALLGVYLLSFILQEKNTPKAITFTHGPLGAIGIIILLIYTILYTPKPIISLIIFIIAACGGVLLVYRDITGKSIPKWLALLHGVIAISGFVFLILFTFTTWN